MDMLTGIWYNKIYCFKPFLKFYAALYRLTPENIRLIKADLMFARV